MRRAPVAASHAPTPADGRNPSPTATASTRAPLNIVRMKLPMTCPVSTDVRLMAIVRKRVMIPSVMSMFTFRAVVSAAAAAVMSRMPGVR